ncbi:MAG: CoA pyrophosphatase [Cryomorphaceae bacterium]|nr:MAG: CoA pyrophosphatase [Cryomorphaceae bacterium]
MHISEIEKLRNLLQGPLPGEVAHRKMLSYHRPAVSEVMKQPRDVRHGSVLIPLYPHHDTIYTSLILRPDYPGVHGGQVAFPGGQQEMNETAFDTALRESNEELGISPGTVEKLGSLTPVYIPPSRFLVSPFVGVLPERPSFVPDPREVASLIEVPLMHLLHDDYLTQRKVFIKAFNVHMDVPCFLLDGHVVWGATAMMISELRELLKS